MPVEWPSATETSARCSNCSTTEPPFRADYGTSVQLVDGAQAIAGQAALAGRLAHSLPSSSTAARESRRSCTAGWCRSWRSSSTADRIVELDVLADPMRLESGGSAWASVGSSSALPAMAFRAAVPPPPSGVERLDERGVGRVDGFELFTRRSTS